MADQFWQYAKEATLSAAAAKTNDDRQGLLELARIWTQAALQARSSSADPDSALPPLPSHLINSIERHREVPPQSCRDPFARPRSAGREGTQHVY